MSTENGAITNGKQDVSAKNFQEYHFNDLHNCSDSFYVCIQICFSTNMLPEGQKESVVEDLNSVECFSVTCSVFSCTHIQNAMNFQYHHVETNEDQCNVASLSTLVMGWGGFSLF